VLDGVGVGLGRQSEVPMATRYKMKSLLTIQALPSGMAAMWLGKMDMSSAAAGPTMRCPPPATV